MVMAIGLLSVLPGCATYALWGYDYVTDEPLGSTTTLEARGSEVLEQELTAWVAGDGTTGFVLAGKVGEPSWRLRPVAGTDVALRLLAEPAWLPGLVVEVVAERTLENDEVVQADATVRLSGTGTAASLGTVVDPATLTEAARQVLAASRRNAFVFASDPWLYLPIVLRRCMDRLSPADLAVWFGEPAQPVRIESFVFVGPDGLPRFEPGMPIPAAAQDPDLPLADRLELLGSVALLLRLDRGGKAQVVQLRPDRLWLWSACEHRDGALQHASSWLLEPLVGSMAPDEAADQRPFAAHLVRTDHRFGRVVQPPGPKATWLRIVLTPLTVLLDCTILLPFNWVASELRNDEEEPPAPSRRR